MKLRSHIFTAILIATAIAFYLKFERIYLFGIIMGVMLPDILEPPTSRFHRKYWHSKRIFKVIILLLVLSFLASLFSTEMFWLFFILLGYETHLLGDALLHGLPR